MQNLQDKRAIVTGGSRGLGLAVVEALVERGVRVTVLARNPAPLAQLRERLGVDTIQGDAADPDLAERTLRDARPDILLLNAGASPRMAPLHEQTWASFSAVWESDVQATFRWTRAALTTPLAPGSRILIGSSGAALGGSPLSGGYAGAKRTQWMMAGTLNGLSAQLNLGIHAQAILPMQLVGETALGQAAASEYARTKGITTEAFLASFGAPMPPKKYAAHIIDILTLPEYAGGTAFGLKGDGIRPLDA